MKLVEDWKDAWKWLSVNIAAIMALLNAAQVTLSNVQSLQEQMPAFVILTPSQLAVTNAILGMLVIWGRLIQQGGR